MTASDGYVCPVCGWPGLREPPWSEAYEHSFEICPSCFFQFGHDDATDGWSYEQWRAQWIASGMLWSSRDPAPPVDWDPRRQLENLGEVRAERPPWWRRLALTLLGPTR